MLLALAMISQVAGQGLLAFALGTLPAPFSSLVIFLEAVAAALFAWILLHEALEPMQWLGGVLILGGIWFARPRNPARVACHDIAPRISRAACSTPRSRRRIRHAACRLCCPTRRDRAG